MAGGICRLDLALPDFVAVVVAPTPDICAVGVDVEPAAALAADIEPLVLTARDRDSIAQLPPPIRALGSRLVFSAKEAFYKALYPTTGVFLDFTQAWVTFATEESFTVATTEPLWRSPPLSGSLVGRYCIEGPHLMTGIFAPAPPVEYLACAEDRVRIDGQPARGRNAFHGHRTV